MSCLLFELSTASSLPHDHGEFQSTPGSAGVASASAANVQRRERLRALALEQVHSASVGRLNRALTIFLVPEQPIHA